MKSPSDPCVFTSGRFVVYPLPVSLDRVLERVEQRLNATYSPSKSQGQSTYFHHPFLQVDVGSWAFFKVNPRIDRAFSRKWKFDDFCKAKELSFLTFPDSPRRFRLASSSY